MDSVVVVRPSPVSVVSSPVVTSCSTEMCVEEWCESDRGEESDVHFFWFSATSAPW